MSAIRRMDEVLASIEDAGRDPRGRDDEYIKALFDEVRAVDRVAEIERRRKDERGVQLTANEPRP